MLTNIKALAICGLIVAAFTWHLYDRGQAYRAGENAERSKWQQSQIDAFKVREADQAKIADIEQKYEAERIRADKYVEMLAAVDDAAEKDKADETANAPGACPPAISRRMRDIIQKSGRPD